MTFLVAGFESTNNHFTNLAYALALHPGVFQEVKYNPELIPDLVEESMRWDAPAQGFVRSPNTDLELYGKVIPQNAEVLLHIGAANRDERHFPEPDHFDIHRADKNHVGMGAGIHFCVGSPLGRLMSRAIFESLLSASECWEMDIAGAKRVETPNFRGFARLPLTIGH